MTEEVKLADIERALELSSMGCISGYDEVLDCVAKVFASHRIANQSPAHSELVDALRLIARTDKSGNPDLCPKSIVQVAKEALASLPAQDGLVEALQEARSLICGDQPSASLEDWHLKVVKAVGLIDAVLEKMK